jgi:hypothetical protein
VVDRRRLIGNDMVSGGTKIKPYRQVVRPNMHVYVTQSQALQARRQKMIAYTAKPPALPLPQPIKRNVPDNPAFNQFAYSLLLVAVMSAIAIATPLINWMFLAYGILAVIIRLPGRLIFISALLCIVITAISSAFSRASTADTFAVMAFYFMVIGLVRAVIEQRRQTIVGNKAQSE